MEIVVSGSLATITAPMQNLASGADRAMREGLYEGGDKVRTRVRRALKVQTNVKAYGSITQRVPGVRAGLTYIIRGEGKGMPIELFPVSAPGPVVASPWGVVHTFKRSFANRLGYRARTTSKRFPIRRLYGPSVAKEIVKDQSAEAFEAGVRADVLAAIEKRLARLFG